MTVSNDSVKWVGRERKCGVDETEKGWYLLHIDGDLETIAVHEVMAMTVRWVEMIRRK
jgi:DNA/RNA-binding protein KIN17